MKALRSGSPWTFSMVLVVVAACVQDTGTSPDDADAADPWDARAATSAIDCTARPDQGVLMCEGPAAPPSGAGPQLHIVGGQGVYVQLTSSAVSYDATSETFQADVTVQNLLADPLGTSDGTVVTGIRVFFHTEPTATSGAGTVTASNADGTGTFTGSAQPYFEYDEMLATGETSAARTWMWNVPAAVEEFSFSVYVHADVPGGGGLYSRVVLGDVQTCALRTPNEAWCWGENGSGVFGNGTFVGGNVPTPGATGLRLRSLSLAIIGADWACGVTLPGDMYCWGFNGYGVQGSGAGSLTPKLVAEAMDFSRVEAGEKHACGLTATGEAYCWGENSAFGNLGDGTLIDRTTPTAVLTDVTFSDIQAGAGFTCGLEASGNVYCWGSNLTGELGDGTTTNRSVPDSVAGNLRFTRLSVGSYHACAVATDGTPYCWGSNGSGQLGDNSYDQRLVPTPVAGTLTVTRISAGDNHTCAVDQVGGGWCWGEGGDGQLGTGNTTSTNVPSAMAGGLQWHSVTAEEEHSCGVSITNEIYCWGGNYDGQLGVPSVTASPVPVKVHGLP